MQQKSAWATAQSASETQDLSLKALCFIYLFDNYVIKRRETVCKWFRLKTEEIPPHFPNFPVTLEMGQERKGKQN